MSNKLNNTELNILYKLVEDITGTSQEGSKKKEIIQNSIVLRMNTLKIIDFFQYLKILKTNQNEYDYFVHLITIHTTSWFRELPHYVEMEKRIIDLFQKGQRHFRVLSLACSTGQEVYSSGLMMELLCKKYPQMSYEIIGSDIDSVSLEIASKCIYKNDDLSQIPKKYHQFILLGFDKNNGFFTLENNLRNKISFKKINLKELHLNLQNQKFDFIFLRNVLIYFDFTDALKLLSNSAQLLSDQGLLMLGHSEFPNEIPVELIRHNSSCLRKNLKINSKMNMQPNQNQNNSKLSLSETGAPTRRRLLLIEDFKVIRASIISALTDCNFIIDEASSAEEASVMLEQRSYDLITLDINLPGESGTQWLRRQRAHGLKTPIVIISSTEAKEAALVFGALSDGAQDYISKEVLYKNRGEFVTMINTLIYSDKKERKSLPIINKNKIVMQSEMNKIIPEVIVIGASTGGPDALWKLLKNLGSNTPPIIIVQHISVQFAEHFAVTLKRVAGVEVSGHIDGEILKRNHIYVARGDYHLTVKSSEKGLYICHDQSAIVNGFRPSVDVLFDSIAQLKEPAMAILLTGMGADGALGMKRIHTRPNTYTIAQTEESCIVFGMPKEAIEMGAVNFVGDLTEIRKQIEASANQVTVHKNKKVG